MKTFFFACFLVACGSSTSIDNDASTNDASTNDVSVMDGSSNMDTSTTDTSTSDVSMMDVTQTDGGPGNYAAYGILGGLDRLRIAKTVGNTCFYIQLRAPGSGGMGLTLPSNWQFEAARAVQPSAACNPKYLGPISNTYDATSQTGTIAFQGNGIPQTVQSVMATLTFANNPNWCPPSETFSATNLPVQ